MTTPPAPAASAQRDTPQERVSRNIVQMLSLRGLSKATLARELGLDPAAVSRRVGGSVSWNLVELGRTAELLGVPWPWLVLPLPDLMSHVMDRPTA